jgi:putative ABC transport system permease protein
MRDVLRIAARNLLRYHRRTLLTALLVTIGVLAVLSFIAISGSFKQLMVGQITDSMLGHIEIHRRGYTASLENLPLNLNMQPAAVAEVEEALKGVPEIAASSPRVKLGAMFSNFAETTAIRLNGVDPAREDDAVPGLRGRISAGPKDGTLVEPGQVLIPDLIARGMKLAPGDTVVMIATNLEGSVNGKRFTVRGVLDPITGPGGRDGYLHIDDARDLLRMEKPEVSEYALRLREPDRLGKVFAQLQDKLAGVQSKEGKPALEVHTWEGLSPFANIARMIDVMTVFIRVMLIAIVLVAVMNVMLMAVYERVREIGTMAALGTPPRRIMGLFVTEGLLLGLVGAAIGAAVSLAVIGVLNTTKVSFAFGRQQFALAPTIAPGEVLFICALVVLIAVLASLQPAWKAARMDPIQALRHV